MLGFIERVPEMWKALLALGAAFSIGASLAFGVARWYVLPRQVLANERLIQANRAQIAAMDQDTRAFRDSVIRFQGGIWQELRTLNDRVDRVACLLRAGDDVQRVRSCT